jgi:DNA-binding phage protein
MADGPSKKVLSTEKFVQDILDIIERDREREIVARRWGLFDRRETLEQIGELLGITRERVRQLEKSVIARFKVTAEQGQLPHIKEVESSLADELKGRGGVARIGDLSAQVTAENSKTDQSRLVFLAHLSPNLLVVDEDDNFYQAVATNGSRDASEVKDKITGLIGAVKKIGKPAPITDIAKEAGLSDNKEAEALAGVSKALASLNGAFGLTKWPEVNPKNIRDKIYVILKVAERHMHFNEIAESIKQSDFKRKDVTTQAIHNELIKDKRFVLIGRGIYALKEWGYNQGTVADIISQVLKEAGEPLHRDEIVRRVLKSRFVKETTILLNLQGKSQFKRVAKATYELDENSI